MDMTLEEYMGEPFRMWLGGVDLSDHFYVLEVSGRSLTPYDIQAFSVSGMSGSYYQGKTIPPKTLVVKALMVHETSETLRDAIDTLNGVLDSEEPEPITFSDEPDRTYFGIFNSVTEGVEVDGKHIVTITFFRPDPSKYGPEQQINFTSDVQTITNEGTADADPNIELTAKEPTTFAMIQNQDKEYQMIGRPVDSEEAPAEKYPRFLGESGSSLIGWSHRTAGYAMADGPFGGIAGGSMKVTGYSFMADTFGTNPNGWTGPMIRRSFSSDIQDFKAILDVGMLNKAGGCGKVVIQFLDASDNIVASMGVYDATNGYANNRVTFRLGGAKEMFLTQGANKNQFDNTRMWLEMTRKGEEFNARVYRKNENGDLNYRSISKPYYDRTNQFQQSIRQVQIYIAKAKEHKIFDMHMHGLSVFGISDLNALQVPYIADVGDVITFDHVENVLRVNGEPRKDLKDFGGSYFKLKKGINQLVVHPSVFDVKCKYRERFR